MTSEFTDLPSIEVGAYEHYKGKRYNVLGVGRHTEQDDYFVIYVPLYEHEGQPDIWIRPYAMFVETVEINGKQMPRFQKIAES